MKSPQVHINLGVSKLCMVCGKTNADTHAIVQDTPLGVDGSAYYDGISWHNDCFNLRTALGRLANFDDYHR